MIFIKTLEEFLNEALRDDIPKHLSDIVSKRHGDKYLDMDIPEHTIKIPNIKIEVKDDNLTNKSISEIVEYFTENIIEQYKKSKFYEILIDENNTAFYNLMFKSIGLNKHPNPKFINEMFEYLKKLYSNEFQLIDNKSTPTDLILSKNKSNIYGFIKSYNNYLKIDGIVPMLDARYSYYFDRYKTYPITYDIASDKVFNGLRDVVNNYEQNIEKIKSHKLYLYITDKPTDKLLMSVSKFYSSCQNIYTGDDEGTEYNRKLLSNVFDPNTKIALLIFDTPYTDQKGNKVSYTSIARTLIRYDIESDKIMFDKTYPSDMQSVMYNIITEYTGLENKGKSGDIYNYKGLKGLGTPYMDKYNIRSNETDNVKFSVMQAYFDCDNSEIVQETDSEFIYDNDNYVVYTKSEATEYVMDYFRERNHWKEAIDTQTIEDCLQYKYFEIDNLIDLFETRFEPNYERDYSASLNTQITTFCEYLNNNDIETVSDMFTELSNAEGNKVEFNAYEYVRSFEGGFEEELRIQVLSHSDGEELTIEYAGTNYFIYKL